MAQTFDDVSDELESQLTPVVSLTDEARGVVRDAINQEPDPESLALWLEVRAIEAGAFVYDLYFQATSDAGSDDALHYDDGLPVVVPAASIDRLRGARLEWSTDGDGGLVLVNPNTPPAAVLDAGIPAEVLAAGLDTPLARRVVTVLDDLVNPSIAGHGGHSDLVALDEAEGVAYVRLSGGCQGCSMSKATLTQGIEVMLKEEIAEITSVIDVTDHGGGENPYY
jgi:Fe/S biogenesis protein NfuA